MPVSEIKPGMTGTGKTVFSGNDIEEFGVQVLDIIKDFYPQRDVILVRLTGEKMEYIGVAGGMSGSPVYIDNKLVGALSFRVGEFMKEPIGGVMPIENMLEVAAKEDVRDIEQPVRISLFSNYLNLALTHHTGDPWSDFVRMFSREVKPSTGTLAKIQAPLIFCGFQNQIIDSYGSEFSHLGFSIIQGGGTSGEAPAEQRAFEPGSPISQVFVCGDYDIETTGTVTAVSGDKLLAFGHYVFNLGPINLPLAPARISATLPSLLGSNKLALTYDVVGSFRQDRLSGVLGDLSKKPFMIPVELEHNSMVDGKHSYRFKMAADPSMNNLMPFFLRIALIQGMTSARLSSGESSLKLGGEVVFENGKSFSFDDFYSVPKRLGFFAPGAEAAEAGDFVAALVGTFMVNDFSAPGIEKIKVTADVLPGERAARIESVWLDRAEIEPGESFGLVIQLKTTKEKTIKLVRKLKVPEKLDADRLSVIVAAASSLTPYEMRINPDKYRPVSFENLLSILRNRRTNDNLYIQVRVRDSGMIVEGTELADLPPSVLAVMNSRRSTGPTTGMANRALIEEVVPTEYAITGAKVTTIVLKSRKQATQPDLDDDDLGQPVVW